MRIGSHIFSPAGSRRLKSTSQALQRSLERLSSGRRINSARDDAAGLSIATTLNAQIRGMSQAVRNTNDGLSMLQIADGALNEMTNILQSVRELAVQAANGTLSNTERSAINNHVASLLQEFDRIAKGTEFNGLQLLDGTFGTRNLQIGTGESSQLGFSLGDLRKELAFQKTVGTGSFQAAVTATLSLSTASTDIGDINNDGFVDMVVLGSQTSGFPPTTVYNTMVILGNGDGTFRAPVSYAQSSQANGKLADITGDGILDLLTTRGGTAVGVQIGNGDGTFRPVTTLASGGSFRLGIEAADLNGDGEIDLVVGGTDSVQVLLGNGDGTFSAATSFAVAGLEYLSIGDINADGVVDVVTSNLGGGTVSVLLGNGDGSLKAAANYATDLDPTSLVVSDFNNDGRDDVGVIAMTDGVQDIFLAAGDGTLQAKVSYSISSGALAAGDINGDGVFDIIGDAGILLGNGDGSFKAEQALTIGNPKLADTNGDGVLDILATSGTTARAFKGITQDVTAIADLDLTTQEKAQNALVIIDSALQRLATERAGIGGLQNRLDHTISTLYVSQESLSAAYSSIIDADIALETAELVRNQILQQAGIAMLAQGNLMQAQVLELLRS